MVDNQWILWMIFAAICIVGEIFTMGFFIFWFGIGAAIAGVIALLGGGPILQWGTFIVVSGVLFLLSRRLSEKFTKKQPPGIGADRFVGKDGIVIEEINNDENTGRVRLKKELWRADSETGVIIKTGEKVNVVKMDGTSLVVKVTSEGE